MLNIRVLLADDRMLVRLGIKSIFADQRDIEVVGESGDFEEILELVVGLKPAVVIIDALAHDLDTDKLTRRIIDQSAQSIGILILANAHDQGVLSAIRSGANGLLLKHSNPAQLISAVQMVAKGYYLLPPPADDGGAPPATPASHIRHPPKERIEQLTERELDVFRLVSHGWSNAEIAQDLALRESTVKSHIRSILAKLDLRNRVHIVIFAYRVGMFPGWASHPSRRETMGERDSA
ncbi:LuxR C-terminal-related transcriptional regulator [Actinomadura sp. HBU206391]|uniref:LuxR C-terminal-related transcriptional regulator n=1 Tax=Actinomadura sp. HBU206391 TaxID=2731692 RepID=UPI00164F94D6|nr:response regulator transcription factor [Actinomadura sp. HBU206391]MBC6456898.1 response regulator transcription factor [Actinomadura sp. HBU206391]